MRTSWRSYLLTGLLVALLVFPPPLMAAVIVVDGNCTLVDAITAANTDSATGNCPAGSGADEIQLTVDVTLTVVDNNTDGANGLPSITSEVTVEGVGGSLPRAIVRDPAAPNFRIFHVGASGVVFGYFGYVLGRGWYEHTLKSILIAIGGPGTSPARRYPGRR